MAGATERLAHVRELLPEICTLDCGTMNFAGGDYVMTNTPSMLREMARQIRELGVRPEIGDPSIPATSCSLNKLVRRGADRVSPC